MSQQQRIQQLLEKSNATLVQAFGYGNGDLVSKWSFDVSQESIANGISKRNLLAAYVNRYMHQFEVAGLWYLHGIISGYLAEEKPDFVTGKDHYVKFPVLAVDEVEYCMDWLHRVYGPRYAAEQAKVVFDFHTGRGVGDRGGVAAGKYRFLWSEEFEQEGSVAPFSLGEREELDDVWRRFVEVPEAYKDARQGKRTKRTVLAGLGSAQLLEEAVEMLDLAGATLRYDEENEAGAKHKKDQIESYDKKLELKITEKKSKALEAEKELIAQLDKQVKLFAASCSQEEFFKIIRYQKLVERVEKFKAQIHPLNIERLTIPGTISEYRAKLAKNEQKIESLLSDLESNDGSASEEQFALRDQLMAEIGAYKIKIDELMVRQSKIASKLSRFPSRISTIEEEVAVLLVDLREVRSRVVSPLMKSYQDLLAEIEDLKCTHDSLVRAGDVEAAEPCAEAMKEAKDRLLGLQEEVRKTQEAAWQLTHFTSMVGLYQAKSRFWDQVKNLHDSYRSDPAEKLGKLIGAVEPAENELLGLKHGIPVGTPAGLRHLLFLFLEKAPEAWANRIPEILRKSGLTFVGITGEEQPLTEADVQTLTETIVDTVTRQLRKWCARFAVIDISGKHDTRTRESLRHLQLSLRGELFGTDGLEEEETLRTTVETGDDMFGHPSLVSPRYISACKIVNTIRSIVDKVQAEEAIGFEHRLTVLRDDIAAMGVPDDLFGPKHKQADDVTYGADELAVKNFVEQGWKDYGKMLHLVAENSYKPNMMPFYLHLLKQGGKAGYEIEGASVTAVLCRKAYLARPAVKEQCWNMFIVARIVEDLFETATGAAYMASIAESIIDKAAAGDQYLSDLYRDRDLEHVLKILRRLVLELCLGEINGRTIWQSEAFQSLMNLWRYNQFGFSTPQTEQEEQQRLGVAAAAADTPGRAHIINLRHLRGEFMGIIRGLFAHDYYQGLEGVRLLAEPNIEKRKVMLKDVSELYLDQARTKEVTLNVAQYVDRSAGGADVKELRERIRKEEMAQIEEQARQQQQALQHEKDAIRKEMDSKVAALQETNKAIQDQMGSRVAELQKANKAIQDQMGSRVAELQKANKAIQDQMGSKVAELQKANKAIQDQMGSKIAELQGANKAIQVQMREALTAAEKGRKAKEQAADEETQRMADKMAEMQRKIDMLIAQRSGANQVDQPGAGGQQAQQPTVAANGSLAGITALRQRGIGVIDPHDEAKSSDEETAGAGC